MRPFLPSYLLAKHLRIVSYNYSLHSTDIKDTGFWLVVFANHEHLHREPHWHSSGPGANFRLWLEKSSRPSQAKAQVKSQGTHRLWFPVYGWGRGFEKTFLSTIPGGALDPRQASFFPSNLALVIEIKKWITG